MKKIDLSNGKFSIVDDDVFDYFSQWKWKTSTSGYARRTLTISLNGEKKYKTVYLHSLILNCVKGQEVDHINLDKLDNRRINLRLVTHQQNQWNRVKLSTNKSGIKGVSFSKQRNKWVAYIKINGKVKNLGGFADINSARLAYEQSALKNFKQFARL